MTPAQEPPRPPSPEPTNAIYRRVIPVANPETQWDAISIRLVGSHSLWGHHLWNAARCFASYLDEHSAELCKDKKILELGAGGGLPSLVCSLNGATKTVITDYPDTALLRNLTFNVEHNIEGPSRNRVDVQGHLWGADVQPLLHALSSDTSERFDLILMSDLIFNHSQHSALLKTCDEVLSTIPPSTTRWTPCALVFYTHHRPHLAERDLDFFRLARERGWACQEIVTEKMEMIPVMKKSGRPFMGGGCHGSGRSPRTQF